MENKKIIFFRSGLSGGTGTLSIRLGKWLIANGYSVIYLCNEFNDEGNLLLMKSIGIKVFIIGKNKEIKNMLEEKCGINDEIKCITYSLNEFFILNKYMKDTKLNYQMFLYIVHNMELVKGLNINSSNRYKKFVVNILNLLNSNVVKKLYLNNNLIFMDYECMRITGKYLKIKFDDAEDKIFNLPMEINEFNRDTIEKKCYKKDKFNILTIARMEFPFKGYIIGLIKTYVKLKLKYSNITLTIIGDGIDIEKVKQEVIKLPYNLRKDIFLAGSVKYSDLENFFIDSHIYIGMGTTLLDACNLFVPAIAVYSYTYECLSYGYFYENSFELGVMSNEGKNMIEVELLINNVISMSKEEYSYLCEKCHSALKEYDINNFMTRLFKLKNKDENVINFVDKIFANGLNLLSKIYHRR